MGLLDDAIKEHLELKRKRGADAEEVARLEQEALGPPQRGEFAGATAPAEPAEPDAEVADAPPARRGRRARARAEPAPEPAEPQPEPEPEPRAGARAEPAPAPAWLEDEPEPMEEPEEVPEGEPVILDQPTVEYAAPAEAPRATTCSRRPRTSCRRRRSTTGCGSSRSRRATSTSTDSRAPLHPAGRLHRPAAGRQRARGRPRRRRPLRRGHARLRARDAAVGDLVRPVARPRRRARRLPPPDLHDEPGRSRSPAIRRSGSPPRWRAPAARRRASYVQQTQPGEQAIDVELEGLLARVSMLQEPPTFGPELDPAAVLAPRRA